MGAAHRMAMQTLSETPLHSHSDYLSADNRDGKASIMATQRYLWPLLLSVSDIAFMCGLSRRRVYEEIASGRLGPVRRIGTHKNILTEDVVRWIKEFAKTEHIYVGRQ